jgi:hypothetical protein
LSHYLVEIKRKLYFFIFFNKKTKAFETQEKTAKIAVNKNPNTVIKGYNIEKTTVQIFDFVCIK